jgi:hypothetical protein
MFRETQNNAGRSHRDAASMRVFGPGDQAAPANTEQLITEGAELQHLRMKTP